MAHGERLQKAQAWLFDLDGTLVEQRVDFALMRSEVLEVVVLMGLADWIPTAQRLPVLELVAEVELGASQRDPDRATAFRAAADAAIERVELLGAPSAQVLPGVLRLLGILSSRGLPVAVVTRNCHAAAAQILTANNIPCDLLVAREDTIWVKPHPGHLLVALDAFGVAGEDAVMCGDYVMDILAGHAVSALTVGVVADGDVSRFGDVRPDIVVRGLEELIAWL